MGNILALKLVMIHSQNKKITVINTSDYFKHRFMLLFSFMIQNESRQIVEQVNFLICDLRASINHQIFSTWQSVIHFNDVYLSTGNHVLLDTIILICFSQHERQNFMFAELYFHEIKTRIKTKCCRDTSVIRGLV